MLRGRRKNALARVYFTGGMKHYPRGGKNAVKTLDEMYRENPQMREYYLSLPGKVRYHICKNNITVTTLGELQQLGEHFSQQGQD